MNLIVDWGNTRIKAAWFEGETLVAVERFESIDALRETIDEKRPDRMIVSSTSRAGQTLEEDIPALAAMDWVVLDAALPVPVIKNYETPRTLGADRIAAAVGAMTVFPGQDCLVLDLGTCITADIVDRSGTFQGGIISPGLNMRLLAMHQQTARLPLIPADELTGSGWPPLTGKNTRQAMGSGALNGMLFELDGIIAEHRKKYPDLTVVLCGGDASLFESHLKPPIFAVPELVLRGLNRILEYNVKKLPAIQ
ncbi:type III pantothenate kinase [Arsenicibacter rosenii]|uniref:Type III pantothenate kinase n=1 Tax=Arsenicibacter rosenii TaxID=1750698 RepID=A0A1S2VFD4_9BACT|nr:type III pantothenate kinase [Arsenicibacter rosenii]OIN57422.1 pantothenate kinase [Arsenicibacter rosenii]